MSQETSEYTPVVYYIPPNFDEAGGVAGGHLQTRNAIEMAAICLPVAYAEYRLLHFSLETNLIIGIVTLLPLAAFCAFGIRGESLFQVFIAYIKFRKNKCKYHYESFTQLDQKKDIDNEINDVVDKLQNMWQKPAKNERNDLDREEYAASDKSTKFERKSTSQEKIRSNTPKSTEAQPQIKAQQQQPRVQANDNNAGKINSPRPAKPKKAGKSLISSATKEMLLRKLELGDDEDY